MLQYIWEYSMKENIKSRHNVETNTITIKYNPGHTNDTWLKYL